MVSTRACLVALRRGFRPFRDLLLTVMCLLAGTLTAHGGQYLGPTGGGQGAPTPRVPGSQPVTPGMVPGGPLTGGDAYLDVGSWRVWWQLNHDRYVRGRGSQVTDAVRRATVLPALKRALDATDDPDINSACLIAMGKAAIDHPDFDVLDVLRARLSRAHLEVREAAVLAMGLSGRPDAFEALDALLRSTPAGRKLVQRTKVADRVRTFAAYALGLLAHRSTSTALKTKVLGSLTSVLEDRRLDDRDVLTGVLNGMRLLGADADRGAAEKRLLWTAIATLERFLERRFKDNVAAVQSHGLTALAAMVGRGDGVERQRATRIVVEVLQRRSQRDPTAYVSATIALGEMLRPEDTEELDVLARCVANPPDSLVPKFAMIAFGKIGGEVAWQQLSRAFRRDKRDVQPWAAIGLGLLAFHAVPMAKPQNQGKAVDVRSEVGKILHHGLQANRNKDLRAAIAIGLGLAGHTAAAPDLRKLATKYKTYEELSGPLCVSLAMLDDKPSIPIARDAMSSVERPVLFGQAGLALARFDQRDASSVAVAVLQWRGDPWPGFLRRLAAATQAIGYLKNGNDVPALVGIISSARRTDYPAAFAAAALGSVADRDPLGFGARVAHGMNYTARVQTISNGRNGILDIF